MSPLIHRVSVRYALRGCLFSLAPSAACSILFITWGSRACRTRSQPRAVRAAHSSQRAHHGCTCCMSICHASGSKFAGSSMALRERKSSLSAWRRAWRSASARAHAAQQYTSRHHLHLAGHTPGAAAAPPVTLRLCASAALSLRPNAGHAWSPLPDFGAVPCPGLCAGPALWALAQPKEALASAPHAAQASAGSAAGAGPLRASGAPPVPAPAGSRAAHRSQIVSSCAVSDQLGSGRRCARRKRARSAP